MVICSGELRQQFSDLSTRMSRDDYYARIYSKTASLFQLATEAAGLLENAPENQVTALREYGRNLGMAFQVADDVLDFVGDEQRLGKPVGSDLRQGLITLPTLRYLEQHPNDELIARLFRDNEYRNDEAIHQAVRAIRDSGATEAALDEAHGFVHRGRLALDQLPEGPARQALQDLADFTIQRRM